MRLPTQKKILKEDLKGAPAWVDNLIQPVNAFMENVYQCLNRNVTFQDNFASFIYTMTYKTPVSYPADVDSFDFLNQLKSRAQGVVVVQAYDKSNYVAAPGPVYAPWVENNGSIVLGTIKGLEANKSYFIRLMVF